MLIHVFPARQHAEVRQVDDLGRFSVVVAGDASEEELERALTPLARLESRTHAWVYIERLRAACGRDDDAAWSQAFEAMVGFAASKGWVDETGTALRAHLVYESAVG
ncbi:hypothetical protein [Streptomyces phaeochromogenes]|uniref:hypothetical protein n=1 Tax=Streptomyces phaeochromogenes TaxID=1923 RepID=UPI0033FCDAE9